MKHIFSRAIFVMATLLTTLATWAQDIIITTDAQKIEAKILEVSKSEIRYKEKDNLDGPTFILPTEDIVTIIYANGKVVLYQKEIDTQSSDVEKNTKEEKAKAQAQSLIGGMFADGKQEKTGNSGNSASGKGAGTQGNPIGLGSSWGHNWSLSGRALRGTLPIPSNNFNQEGTVIVQICVNAAGIVVDAKVIGGNVSDRQTQQLALEAAKKAKFSEGSREDIGTITYRFKIN